MRPFEANAASLKTHVVPAWFHDAKFGVMIHWGLYSVPGWAERSGTIQELWGKRGPNYYCKHNPYAEWYANTIQIASSGAQQHHATTYGSAPYDAFAPDFDAASATVDFSRWTNLFAEAQARYVVLTTKHMDGYCLWPTRVPNPHKSGYHSTRDLVSDVTEAVRARGLRMGLYYSAGYDMTFNATVIRDVRSLLAAIPQDAAYARYIDAQLRELIERFAPDVLWNDVAYPPQANLEELFAHYYNAVPEGVVNDRWARIGPVRGVSGALLGAVSASLPVVWPLLPSSWRRFRMPPAAHYDFTTPEYASEQTAVEHKWESVRGIGPSFGNNRNETDSDLPSVDELIRTLVDVVSKNGNLLLGVGPEPNGEIPALQQQRLRGLGAWLRVNGEAIFDTRPWLRAQRGAEGSTSTGIPIRFTRRDTTVYAIVLDAITPGPLVINDFTLSDGASVHLLGSPTPLDWQQQGPHLAITIPPSISVSFAASAFRLG